MAVQEIVLPETSPETEWVRGRPLQKVSPTRSHARLQTAFGVALWTWAEGLGEVGTEWRFRVAPPDAPARPLVPDIVYVSYERLQGLTGRDLEVPLLAPDVAVEILSPDDRRIDVDDKIATYLDAGSALVIVVDPQTRIVELHDRHGCNRIGVGSLISHLALPGFELTVSELFAAIDPPR